MNPQNFHSLESTLQKYFIYDTHMRNSPRKSIPFTNRDHGGEYCTTCRRIFSPFDTIPRVTWRNHRRRGKGTLPNYQSYFCWWRTDLHLNKPAVSHRDCRDSRSRRGKGSLVRLSSPRNQKWDQFNRVSTLLLVLLSCLLSSSPSPLRYAPVNLSCIKNVQTT